ncbi:translin-associated factor TraX [Blastomyces dermatitidis ATCC 18188]|uniref:Translin-associated factor TraX n=1 Tax=Ajellomyces dermatitidis (strain ATCC 18188 / CBS 674.68) TaxID=653446 RepID=F2TTM4_AJEDA|nr:translin-associated factor TraX [Blastomyces dermatitidis ATCC 18188]
MAGTKRSWVGDLAQDPKSDMTPHDSSIDGDTSTIRSIFNTFRGDLDEHHDRRERVIKASRDITALSKKIIFSLHRVRALNKPLPKNITEDNQERLAQITALFNSVVPDLAGINEHRYQWQISPGIQEYIEAATFQHYVETQRLMSLDDVTESLPPGILVTEADYILGLFDLTGEMMRFAITTMSADSVKTMSVDGAAPTGSNEKDTSRGSILLDLRQLRAMFESINVPRGHSLNRDFGKKLEVMQRCVEKVERAAYGLLVRGSERPGGWIPDLTGPPQVESY